MVAADADVKVGYWGRFLVVFLRLQAAHRVLGFPSLHTEGFQQASRWKLIKNGCGRAMSSGCRTDLVVAALQFNRLQATDASGQLTRRYRGKARS
jgi:hypothetical protein